MVRIDKLATFKLFFKMTERDKLIQEYGQRKIAHDQQEEVLRKSKHPNMQNDLKSGTRRKKLSKQIISSNLCNQ